MIKIKTALIVIFVLLTAMSTTSGKTSLGTESFDNPNLPIVSGDLFVGTNSSGGGNASIGPSPFANEQEIIQSLGKAQYYSWAFYNRVEWDKFFPHSLFFKNQLRSIQRVINNPKLYDYRFHGLDNSKPCKDKYGHAHDASIFAKKPNQICVDVSSIRNKKIPVNQLDKVTSELIVHEISHFFGTNESQAEDIANYFSDRFKDISFSLDLSYSNPFPPIYKTYSKYKKLLKYVSQRVSSNEEINKYYLCNAYENFIEDLSHFKSQMFTKEEIEFVKAIKIKSDYDRIYFCDIEHMNSKIDEYHKREIVLTSMNFHSFFIGDRYFGYNEQNRNFVNIQLIKINDNRSILKSLTKTHDYLERIRNYIYSLRNCSPGGFVGQCFTSHAKIDNNSSIPTHLFSLY